MKALTAHQQNELLALARSIASTFREQIENDTPMDSGGMCDAINAWFARAARVLGLPAAAPEAASASETRCVMACTTCGGTDVRRDAWAEWDLSSQRWALGETFDDTYCHDCEGETRLEERPLLEDAEAVNA